jgi:hypothetical protein
MNRIAWAGATLAAILFVLSSTPASAQEYSAKLSGFQEVGGLNNETGAILSTAEGTLKLTLDKTAQTIAYTLTYTFPATTTTSTSTGVLTTATTDVLQSHIHFGKEHVPGNVMVYFCSTAALAPAAPAAVPPVCPVSAGTSVSVSGTLHPADVTLKAVSQNVLGGTFDAVASALTSDTAYVNIHTAAFPGGEIRGQIRRVEPHRRGPGGRGNDHDHGNDKDWGHNH